MKYSLLVCVQEKTRALKRCNCFALDVLNIKHAALRILGNVHNRQLGIHMRLPSAFKVAQQGYARSRSVRQ